MHAPISTPLYVGDSDFINGMLHSGHSETDPGGGGAAIRAPRRWSISFQATGPPAAANAFRPPLGNQAPPQRRQAPRVIGPIWAELIGSPQSGQSNGDI